MTKNIILALLLQAIISVKITIMESDSFCFEENIPADYVQYIEYEIFSGKKLNLVVKFENEIYFEHVLDNSKKKISMPETSLRILILNLDGKYLFCLYNIDNKNNVQENVKLSFRFEEDDIEADLTNQSKIIAQHDLDELEHWSNKIKNKIQKFEKEQAMNLHIEYDSYMENQKVDKKILYIAMMQTLATLIIGFLQIYSLKKFFQQKKLI